MSGGVPGEVDTSMRIGLLGNLWVFCPVSAATVVVVAHATQTAHADMVLHNASMMPPE
jgi:hypothetical protein